MPDIPVRSLPSSSAPIAPSGVAELPIRLLLVAVVNRLGTEPIQLAQRVINKGADQFL